MHLYSSVESHPLPSSFAFVEYSTKQEARNAFQALSSTHLYGRRLAIEFAEDDQSVEAMRAKTSRDFAQNDSRSRRDRSKRVKFDD
jgi:multiple RNA-binding domain-containing protein 1